MPGHARATKCLRARSAILRLAWPLMEINAAAAAIHPRVAPQQDARLAGAVGVRVRLVCRRSVSASGNWTRALFAIHPPPLVLLSALAQDAADDTRYILVAITCTNTLLSASTVQCSIALYDVRSIAGCLEAQTSIHLKSTLP